jgi:hypothetical protein
MIQLFISSRTLQSFAIEGLFFDMLICGTILLTLA